MLPSFILSMALLFTGAEIVQAEQTKTGTVTGGVHHAMPDWFKDSFLEFVDDAEEAGDADKHLLLFFQLNACPMVVTKRNFSACCRVNRFPTSRSQPPYVRVVHSGFCASSTPRLNMNVVKANLTARLKRHY